MLSEQVFPCDIITQHKLGGKILNHYKRHSDQFTKFP